MTALRGPPDLPALAAHCDRHGLTLRGGFNFLAHEDAPARAVVLVGNAGAAYWPHFQAWLAEQPQPVADPLDTWSRAVISEAAAAVGARAISPSDKPYWPFQQWAMRGEGLRASPLGILMHPDYGLWHAYRGALLFDRELPLPDSAEKPHLCDTCEGKPCLKACPVDAYTANGFAYGDCVAYVRSESDLGDAFPHSVSASPIHLSPFRRERKGANPFQLGLSSPSGGGRGGARSATEWGNHVAGRTAASANVVTCRTAGCRDRNACPFGTAFRYPSEVQAFHMAAFARL